MEIFSSIHAKITEVASQTSTINLLVGVTSLLFVIYFYNRSNIVESFARKFFSALLRAAGASLFISGNLILAAFTLWPTAVLAENLANGFEFNESWIWPSIIVFTLIVVGIIYFNSVSHNDNQNDQVPFDPGTGTILIAIALVHIALMMVTFFGSFMYHTFSEPTLWFIVIAIFIIVGLLNDLRGRHSQTMD